MAKEEKAATIGQMAQAIVDLDSPKDTKGNPLGKYSALQQGFEGKVNEKKIKPAIEAFHVLSPEVKKAAHEFVTLKKELGDSVVETKGVFTVADGKEVAEDALTNLTKSYATLAEANQGPKSLATGIVGLNKTLKGMTGMVQTEGLLGAVGKNFNPNGNPVAFARMGVTALCAVGAVNGITQSKTKDGEDRSILMRGGQIAIFTLGAAAAMLLGKAHMGSAVKACSHAQ